MAMLQTNGRFYPLVDADLCSVCVKFPAPSSRKVIAFSKCFRLEPDAIVLSASLVTFCGESLSNPSIASIWSFSLSFSLFLFFICFFCFFVFLFHRSYIDVVEQVMPRWVAARTQSDVCQ